MQSLRQHFISSQSVEVQTPVLSAAATTDPYIDSFKTGDANRPLWLHTSPEFLMKRLLAEYQVDIHQFATVFRQDESGKHHNREFVMLEWYRMGFRLNELIQDAVQLINTACQSLNKPSLSLRVVSYTEAVKALCGGYPEQLSVQDIADVFKQNKRSFPESLFCDTNPNAVDDALTLLVDEFVVSQFSANEITALTEYPASQASLAKIGVSAGHQPIALRAELFIGSVELANGFEELTDADEQLRRFQTDNKTRCANDKPQLPFDARLIEALRHGLPACAGMALGVDRLFMVLGNYAQLSDVMTFADDNA